MKPDCYYSICRVDW